MDKWIEAIKFYKTICVDIPLYLLEHALIPVVWTIAPEIIFFVVIVLIIEVIARVRGEIITRKLRTCIWAICCLISFVIGFI